MRRLALLAAVFLSGTVLAADDLTVLKPGTGETPPRKLLHAALLAECDMHFAARKAEVEKLKTPADVTARQTALRAKFIDALGGFPEKTPLNAKTVGTLKRDKLEQYKSAVALDLMRSIKRALDPTNLMNPGRVLRM